MLKQALGSVLLVSGLLSVERQSTGPCGGKSYTPHNAAFLEVADLLLWIYGSIGDLPER